ILLHIHQADINKIHIISREKRCFLRMSPDNHPPFHVDVTFDRQFHRQWRGYVQSSYEPLRSPYDLAPIRTLFYSRHLERHASLLGLPPHHYELKYASEWHHRESLDNPSFPKSIYDLLKRVINTAWPYQNLYKYT